MKIRKKKCKCKKCVKFRKEYSFDFLDIYGLYYSIAEYLAPRLKAFKKYTFSHPCNISMKEWKTILNKMIIAFQIIAKEGFTEKDTKKIEEGFKLFIEYYHDLWI